MTSSSSIIQRVNSVLENAITDQRARWSAVDPQLSVVFDEIALLASSGKRLRPQFVHWGWIAAGGSESAVEPDHIGAAVELLHAFALFHDDVIDDAHTRRGNATTHVRMTHMHESRKWAGESRRFGEGVATLIGDITYVMSDALMDSLSVAARLLWHELRLEMNIGQYLDTVMSARRSIGAHDAQLVTIYKTAKYTIERPLHIGAVAANDQRGHELMPMLSSYALPLGEAFQLRDDLLGAFGDASITGKPVGGDFIEGKRTPLLAYAMENASESQRHILNTIGDSSVDVEQVQEAVLATGAVSFMESRIQQLHHDAVQSLQQKNLAGAAYNELIALASAVTQREF